MMTTAENIDKLIERQLTSWQTAHDNYNALSSVRVKWIDVDGIRYKAQFNPARIVSSGAKVDAVSIRERRCFLCRSNRPSEQEIVDFKGHYDILVNPFPIFPRHLTIVEREHTAQCITGRIGDMLDMAQALPDFTIFYNGPKCGASAPDHMHFQAGSRGFMPIEDCWHELTEEKIATYGSARLWIMGDKLRTGLVIDSDNKEEAVELFEMASGKLPKGKDEYEPMMNLLSMYTDRRWVIIIFPRAKHRPSCYNAAGDDNLLCSPASVDLGGAFVIPLEKDFVKISASHISEILHEVCLPYDKLHEMTDSIKNNINQQHNQL